MDQHKLLSNSKGSIQRFVRIFQNEAICLHPVWGVCHITLYLVSAFSRKLVLIGYHSLDV